MIDRRKENKFNAQRVEKDGRVFDSYDEYKRYEFLKSKEDDGLIHNLQCQVRYELLPNIYEKTIQHLKTKDKVVEKLVQRKVIYTADFVYEKGGETIVEDFKGDKFLVSRDFPLRKKMMRYFHGINVKVVDKPREEP